MQFCPECNDLSVRYVEALKEAHCSNVAKCQYRAEFDTYEECKDSLGVYLKKWVKGQGMMVAPWSGAIIETEMDEPTLLRVTGLAKELHGVFTQASVNNEMMQADEASPFDEIPENVKDALVELACYVHDKFIRRKDEST